MSSHAFFRFQKHTGPKNYIFIDPDTAHEYSADSRQDLISYIEAYRFQNKLPPIEHLPEVLEHYWCMLPENQGACEAIPLQRGLLSYLKGGISLLQNIFYGDENMVDDAEAERRAAICTKCEYNVFLDKGPFIKWSDEVAEASTGGRRTTLHDQLGNCSVCSCPLRAKVFYKGPFKLTQQERYRLADIPVIGRCWQLSALSKEPNK